MNNIQQLTHTFLQSSLWIGVTVACYLAALGIRKLFRDHPLANPLLIAVVLVILILLATGTPYPEYFRDTWLLTFLLAPATVALGLPLAKNLRHIHSSFWGIALALGAGSVASMLSGIALVRLFGGDKSLAMSMLPKAVTTPIAMAVSSQVGGQPALTASLTIVGGIITAVTLEAILKAMRVTHGHAVGLAAGTAGSGAAAAQVSPHSDGHAAFAAIGIGLNGLLTALLAPLAAALWR
ncbi:MAG TPA: LrgB family protein [Phycisphaerae bacterium]|nr:LrgB family protein [Phycisphaerae bacterium]